MNHVSLASAFYLHPPFTSEDYAFRWRHAECGIVLRLPSHVGGRLGVRVQDGRVLVEVGLGPHVLRIDGAGARLELARILPETVLQAIVGREVGRVVSHPLLTGRPYPITAVSQESGVCTIVFGTGEIPIDLSRYLPCPRRTVERVARVAGITVVKVAA